MTTYDLLVRAWAPGLVVPLVCVLACVAYVARFRGRLGPRSALFVLGVVVFFAALASPIGVLARGYLFSAHMLQHLLLMLAVPPLVLLGWPRDATERAPSYEAGAFRLTLSWGAGVGAMWIWHAPALCNAAAVSAPVQAFQTLSLVAMGLAFWRPVLAPRVSSRMPPLVAIPYLFAACVACTILGIVVTLSPVEVCTAYLRPVDALGVMPLVRDGWGLTCKADQELGGLMMWVPACLVYAAAILATLARFYAEERPAHAVGETAE